MMTDAAQKHRDYRLLIDTKTRSYRKKEPKLRIRSATSEIVFEDSGPI
jgi:hypothetical protein